MDLSAPLAWLVDEAGTSPSPERFLADLGGQLLSAGLPLAGGALTLAVPHPIVTQRTWLWQAETGAVIEALGFAGTSLGQAGHDWLGGLGPTYEETIGTAPDSPVLGWAGTRPFDPTEVDRLRQVARFAAALSRALPRARRYRPCSKPISDEEVPPGCRTARCAAAPARPSAQPSSAPTSGISPPFPKRPSRRW